MALLDPAVRPSAAASAKRVELDAKIANTTASALPAGFSVRLPTVDLGRSKLELVGPRGVSGLFLKTDATGLSDAAGCRATRSETDAVLTVCETRNVPGGKLHIAHDDTAFPGQPVSHSTSYSFLADGAATEISAEIDDATSTPGMTPDQFLDFAKAPGIAQITAAVNAEAEQ